MRTNLSRAFILMCLSGCGGGIEFGPDDQWPTRNPLPGTGEARFMVTDSLSDTLSFVSGDPAQLKLITSAPIVNSPVETEAPHHAAVAPDGRVLYVNLSNYAPGTGSGPHGAHGTGTVPGSVLKLDAKTLAKLGETIVDRSPGDIALSKDGKTAYVSHYDLARLMLYLTVGGDPASAWSAVAVIDTDSMQRLALLPVCPTAHGLGLSRDEQTLFVTCSESDELAVLDVSDRSHPKVTARVPVGPAPGRLGNASYSPYALAVSPLDGKVWISCTLGSIRVFDPATLTMDSSKVVNTPSVPVFGNFTRDGQTFYVALQGGTSAVSVIDTGTLMARVIPLPDSTCINAHAVTLAPDDGFAAVVCEGDRLTTPGTVVWLANLAVLGSVKVGVFPDSLTWLPPIP